jgi:hypothetical protein
MGEENDAGVDQGVGTDVQTDTDSASASRKTCSK